MESSSVIYGNPLRAMIRRRPDAGIGGCGPRRDLFATVTGQGGERGGTERSEGGSADVYSLCECNFIFDEFCIFFRSAGRDSGLGGCWAPFEGYLSRLPGWWWVWFGFERKFRGAIGVRKLRKFTVWLWRYWKAFA